MLRHTMMVALVALASLAAPASASEGWLNDYDKALKLSAESGKPILADFSGTDWCGPCQMLDANVFEKKAFKTWAAENVVLLKLEFLRHSKLPPKIAAQNERLANKYGITGFPTVLLLDSRGETFGVAGYGGGGPDAFIKLIDARLKAKPKPFALDPNAPKVAYDGGWIDNDYEKTLTVAAQQNRYPFILITGTAWADAAGTLKKQVLDEDAFKTFADKHLVLMLVDVPNPNKPNDEFREKVAFAVRMGVTAVPAAILKSPDNLRLTTVLFDPEKPEQFLPAIKSAVAAHRAEK